MEENTDDVQEEIEVSVECLDGGGIRRFGYVKEHLVELGAGIADGSRAVRIERSFERSLPRTRNEKHSHERSEVGGREVNWTHAFELKAGSPMWYEELERVLAESLCSMGCKRGCDRKEGSAWEEDEGGC
jgi:hypothetical protein